MSLPALDRLDLIGMTTMQVNGREADGRAVVTRDGTLSAQFEHTVAVTRNGVRVLTLRPDENRLN